MPVNAVVAAGHTLRTHGTLSADSSLKVEAGNAAAPGGVVIVTGAAENDGFVVINGSYGPSDSAATVTIAQSGVLTNNGGIVVGLGGGLSGDGVGPTIQIYGKLYNNDSLRFGEGYAGTPDTMTIASTGLLQNTGVFYLSGARGGPAGMVPGATLVDAGVLTNSGTLQLFGGYSGNGIFGQGALLDVTGSLTNTGLIDMKGAYGAADGGAGQGTSGTLDITGVLDNHGVLTIDAANTYGNGFAASGSTVRLDGSYGSYNYFNNFGAIDIGGGNFENLGTVSVGGGAGSLFASAGGLGGQFVVAAGGNFADRGGTVDIGGGQSGGAGGTLDDSGYAFVGNGYIGGTIALQAGAAGSGGGTFIDSSFFSVEYLGTIDIAGGVSSSAATMTVASGGVLYDGGLITGAGTLVNDGLIGERPADFTTQAHGVISIAHLVNNGTIDATYRLLGGDTLEIYGALSASAGATGVLSVVSGADLALFGSVASSQTVSFSDTGSLTALLGLADPTAFAGTLAGLGSFATIDFLKLDVTGASSTGDTLAVTIAGSGTVDLALAAPLAAGTSFSLSGDHAGGTDLHIVAPSASDPHGPGFGHATASPAALFSGHLSNI
jgi:hypothetical protein